MPWPSLDSELYLSPFSGKPRFGFIELVGFFADSTTTDKLSVLSLYPANAADQPQRRRLCSACSFHEKGFLSRPPWRSVRATGAELTGALPFALESAHPRRVQVVIRPGVLPI